MRAPSRVAAASPLPIRAQAARALLAVARGNSLDQALLEIDAAHPQAGFARALCYESLRRAWSADALLRALSQRAPKPQIAALLRAGLTELRYLSTPPHAAVAETVNAAQRLETGAAGYVNAVLRRFLRERDALELTLAGELEARHEHPRWLIDHYQRDWPAHWEALCAAGNESAPMWLRVDARSSTRSAYADELRTLGLQSAAPASPPMALCLQQAVAVDALPGFADGRVSVQDVVAQRVVEELDLRPGLRVLDACAAPGGKTAAIAERVADLDIVAIESDPMRAPRLTQTLARCRVHAKVLIADATQTSHWWDGRWFDRILIDAPCSGTGVIRRHPDIKHLRRPSDLAALVATQARLLDALWPLLAPGGRLTYATCSVLALENQAQIAAFLSRTPLARVQESAACDWGVPASPGRQNLSGQDGGDGFYYATLVCAD